MRKCFPVSGSVYLSKQKHYHECVTNTTLFPPLPNISQHRKLPEHAHNDSPKGSEQLNELEAHKEQTYRQMLNLTNIDR